MAKSKLVTEYLKKLSVCNAETDTLEISLAAFRDGHISKEQLDDLTSICPQGCSQVPTVAERRTALLKYIHTNLQRKLEMPTLSNESEVLALARQALSDGVIYPDVLDQLTSLHPQVPIPMRHRYLLMRMRPSLTELTDKYWRRVLQIVPYQIFPGFEPFKFIKVAVKDNLIDQSVLDHLTTLCPEEPRKLRPTENFWSTYTTLVEELACKMSLVKPVDRFLPRLDSSNRMMDNDFPLGPEHLFQLNELLSSYAHRWRYIAIMLKFKYHDLRNIETSPLLIPTAPKSYLTRVLEEWLQRAQKYTLPPTLNNLKRALNSQSVGLGILANDLVLQSDDSSWSLPAYSCIKVSSAMEPAPPLHAEIYLEENNTTLLEISSLSNSNTYVWLKDGIEFAQGSILYLTADIDWDGSKFSCKVSGLVKTSPVTVHVDCPLDKFKGSLAAVYLAQPEVPEDTWPPVRNRKFINLALIKQEKVNCGSEYMRQTIRGDMDDILQHKETIKYSDLYNSLKSGQLVFIEGRPGCGKTTFVHKITQDWANKKSEGLIRLLLLVSLRVLNTFPNPNLSDILKLFSDLKVSQELIEQRDGKGVCFIFDGLDEFSPPDGDNSIVYKIIMKTYLSQSIVIVASRPAAIAKLRNRAHKVVEVLGFLNDQIFEYFDHYPFSSSAKSAELKVYLKSHPDILHMCYLPIHAVMVAFLFDVTGSVPRTETEVYKHFTRSTLMRSLSKNKEIEPSDIDINSLNPEQQKLFKQICQLALEKTVLNRQVLDQDDVRSFFQVKKHGDISLGLITVDHTAGLYGFKNIYTFQHLTFQEYLAAYHISILSKEQQMELIKEHGDENHMLVVWKFYCGLVEIDESAIRRLIVDKANKNFHQSILYAYESQQTEACTELLKTLDHNIKLAELDLLTSDYTALGYIINNNTSEVPVRLPLINCDINSEAVDALLSEITHHRKLEICVQRNSIDNAQVTCIQKLLVKASFTELSVTLKDGMKKDFVDLPLNDFNYSYNIAKLSIPNISGMLQIGAVSFIHLEFLNLSGCMLEFSEIEALADGLKFSAILKHLDVSNNRIGSKGARLLAEGLKGCKVLQKFIVCNNMFSVQDMTNVLTSIRHNYLKVVDWEIVPSLKVVDRPSLKVVDRELVQSLKVVDRKIIPASVIICDREIVPYCGNHVARAELMKLLTNLLSLDITLDSLKKDIQSFCLHSKSWKELRELKVSVNLNTDTEAICSCLEHFNMLETLVLRNGIISMKSAKLLKVGCGKCPNLKVIDLKDNKIGSSERKYILDNFNISVLMPPVPVRPTLRDRLRSKTYVPNPFVPDVEQF